MRADQIALQLYTVRRLAATDLSGTLRRVAAAGYRAVELAGMPSVPVADLAGMLADNDLAVIAAHEPLQRLRDDPDGVVAGLRTLGCSRAVVPWLPEQERGTQDDVRRVAAELGDLAATLGEGGIRLAYHNHAFEFEPLDGSSVWQVLVADLPPGVELELDVYWASIGGADPVAAIRANSNRVRLLHMKDRESGPEPRDAPPGSGILPWSDIVEAGRDAGVEWYVVEQDEPRDPIADVTGGLRYLRNLALDPSAPAA